MDKSATTPLENSTSEAFRETFLSILSPEEATLLRNYGNLLHSRFLDRPVYEVPATSYTEAEMQGALADLRSLAEFLRAVGREREASELPEREWQLSHVAAELAGGVVLLAEGLDRELRRLSARGEKSAKKTDGE